MTTTTYSASRLYVGNLGPTVDEYTLIQLCSKFGKIARMDYLFHKTGPQKGKPRGYAFVEFETKQEALRAITALHDKLIRGRKIVVTAAAEQTSYPEAQGSTSGSRMKGGRPQQDVRRPTAISLLKGQGVTGVSTDRKIAALEAKLLALRKGKEPASESSSSGNATASTSTIVGLGSGSGSAEAGGEEWLNSLGAEGIHSSAAVGSTEGSQAESSSSLGKMEDGSARKIVVDAQKAGLPAKPWFESAPVASRTQ